MCVNYEREGERVRKQNLRWFLIILLLLMVLSSVSIAYGPALIPTIYVDPPTVIDRGLTIGDRFTVDTRISDANHSEHTDVYSWQVRLQWDPLVLDINDTVVWGDFLDAPREGWWGVLLYNAPAGQKEVNVTDGSKYQVGYEVFIEDDSNSEWNTVAGIVGNRLTMVNNLANTYNVVANAGCYPKADWTPAQNINHGVGRIIYGQTTNGPAPGQCGDGLLSTLEFEVLDNYNETYLDIDYTFTYIKNDIGEKLGDEAGELNKESGFFSNMIPGDIDCDGDVDPDDFSIFAGAYGTSPPSDPGADLDHDGDVDPDDFSIFAGNYGKSV